MKLLVLGGTRLLGRHPVGAAAARRHQLTLFNRGRSSPGLQMRPLAETVIDTARWATGAEVTVPPGIGLSADLETQLLRVLRSGRGG
jgi:uncharacterized protein YbjT (DUF2867 family)